MKEPPFLFKKRFYRTQKWIESGIEAAKELNPLADSDIEYLEQKRREYGLTMQSLQEYKEKRSFDNNPIINEFRTFEKIDSDSKAENSETEIERIFRKVQKGVYRKGIEKIKTQRRYNHDRYPDERIKDFGSYENFGKFLKGIEKFNKKDVVLDVGCGDGKECEAIQPFVSRVIGIDIVPPTSNKFVFIEADAEKLGEIELPFNPTKIMCLKTLPSVELWEKFFSDCSKISSSLLTSFPTKYERGKVSILSEWVGYAKHLLKVNHYEITDIIPKENELFILGESVQ